MKHVKALAIVALMAAGCAKTPDTINPSYISPNQYASYDCKMLALEEERLQTALDTASKEQTNAHSQDVAGVILLGMPVSTLSGANIAPEVARLKGELQAAQRMGIQKKCNK